MDRNERDEAIAAFRKFTRLGLSSLKLDTFDAYARIKGCSRSYEEAHVLLAVYDTFRLLRLTGNTETADAVRAVYCKGSGRKPKRNEISMRVLRYAYETHCDERTVYRRLGYAKKLYRQLKG